jgi:16S rRNA (uracil1498-N3)-methyltransferase
LTANHFLVKPKNLHPPYAWLEDEEHHHLSRVLRMGPGERVWLLDEQGNSYQAEVMEVGRRQTRLLLLEKKETPARRLRLVLAQALLKSKNMDLIVQKATELGAAVIVPIDAARSLVRLGEKETPKLERWRKIAREAAKQSRRSDVPSIEPLQSFLTFLGSRDEPRKLILSENGGRQLRDILAGEPGPPEGGKVPAVVILVGPEGGWTVEEERQALERGFEAVSLGGRILRSETASLAVSAAISIFWGA